MTKPTNRLLNKVLVIDEMPVIGLGLQEAFRAINPEVTVESAENLFTVLSSPAYHDHRFDLVIAAPPNDGLATDILQPVTDLREKFPDTRILLFAESYDPSIIEKMKPAGVDAYVHKYEPVEELRTAYRKLAGGESYISGIFHTVYFKYGMNPAFIQRQDDLLISVGNAQREVLLLLCQGRTFEQIAGTLQKPLAEIARIVQHFSAKL